MADLLIIGCPDETTAETAAAEVSRPPRTSLHEAEQPAVATTGGTPSGSVPRCGPTR
jgi:hypothetical protein